MNMKKILFILPSLKNTSPINGAINYIKVLKEKYEILLIALEKKMDNSVIDKINKLNIEYLFLKYRKWNIISIIKELNNYINYNNIDLIISMLLRPDIISSLLNSSVIKITSVREMTESQYINDYGLLMGKLISILHLIVLKKIKNIIVLSDEMKDYFIKLGFNNKHIYCVYNYIDEKEIDEKKYYDICFPFNNFYPTIIVSSLLIKRKNVKYLLSVLSEIYNKNKEFNILILGDGPLKDNLIKYSKKIGLNNILFLGFKENPYPYLVKSDIYISVSLSEGVPKSLIEALYLGKICIVSNIPGHRSLINNGDNGYIFADTEELKNLINKALKRQLKLNKKGILLNDKYRQNINEEKLLYIIDDLL